VPSGALGNLTEALKLVFGRLPVSGNTRENSSAAHRRDLPSYAILDSCCRLGELDPVQRSNARFAPIVLKNSLLRWASA
jgi:hypothetical protein